MAKKLARQDYERILRRLDRFSYYTDSNIRIPFTRITFGLSPLIGLIPVLGDLIGLVLSLYVLQQARLAGASKGVQARMIRNMLIEFLGGLLPVFGDAFDAVYKANTRNTRLLRNYLEAQLEDESPPRFPWRAMVLISVLLMAILALWLWA